MRSDDTYLGFLTELFNTPFLLSPRKTPMGFHQTDQRLGSDCAAFAIYGRRRQGHPIPYCGPFRIYDYLNPISESAVMPDSRGIYRDVRGMPLLIGETGLRAGDILHFHSQVSVFACDCKVKGVLDKSDWIMQAHGNSPGFFALAESGYYNRPLMAYRWKASP